MEKMNEETIKHHNKAQGSKHGSAGKIRLFPRKPVYIIGFLLMALAAAAFLVMLIITDLLPPDLTVILSVSTLVFLFLASSLFASKRRWKRIVGILIALILIAGLTFVADFMRSTYAMMSKISDSNTSVVGPISKKVNVTEEPFNVYITGIDQWEFEKGLDLERSDVNMLVTVNPVTKKILLTSIPRDSYVKLHTAQQMDKLTHTGVYGVDETLNTVEDWLGIDINYYVKMNFTGAKDIINAMDGIAVYSPVAFESSIEDYKYEKGWNAMGGSKALYYARERKAFEGQDSIRVENQQRVMQAIIKKMTSKKTLITKYGDILAAAGDNLSTNMSAEEMTDLAKMQITDMAEWDVQTQKLEGDYDMDYVASLSQANKYSIYRVDPSSIKKCVSNTRDIMNPGVSELEEAKSKNTKSFVINYINGVTEKINERFDDKDK